MRPHVDTSPSKVRTDHYPIFPYVKAFLCPIQMLKLFLLSYWIGPCEPTSVFFQFLLATLICLYMLIVIRLSMSFFTNGIPRCSAQGPTVGRCAHCRRIGANTAVPARIILSMQSNSILLTMGTTAILLPAVYISVLSKSPADANQQRREQAKEKQALQLSRSVCAAFDLFLS